MAGDWIKVEAATLHKPEVMEAAELLNISRREAIGLFIDYFAWLDQHLDETCPGVVPHVSRRSLESVLVCPGFASVIETINWAKFDDSAKTLTVINSDRHNGKTAKTRALEQRKKALQRRSLSRSRPDINGTESGPEKRREDIKGLTAKPVDKSTEPQKPNNGHWWRDLDSIVAKGRELGIEARPGEERDSLYRRVREAVSDAP